MILTGPNRGGSEWHLGLPRVDLIYQMGWQALWNSESHLTCSSGKRPQNLQKILGILESRTFLPEFRRILVQLIHWTTEEMNQRYPASGNRSHSLLAAEPRQTRCHGWGFSPLVSICLSVSRSDHRASQVLLVVLKKKKKKPAYQHRKCNVGSRPESGRSSGGGHGNPLQSLAWRIPWTDHWLINSWTWLKWLSIHMHAQVWTWWVPPLMGGSGEQNHGCV